MKDLAGAVVWAVVPFVPEAPVRLYAGEAHAPMEVAEAAKLIAAARKGADSEFTFLVPGKARPVLIVSDPVVPKTARLGRDTPIETSRGSREMTQTKMKIEN